jgi:hypothetical protein
MWTISRTIFLIGMLSGLLCSCISFALPQPRSSKIAAAAMRAPGRRGRFHHGSGQRLMAVSVYDRASDSMCPRFFGIFRSSCLSAHQVVAELALQAGCGLVAPHRIIVHFIMPTSKHSRGAAG